MSESIKRFRKASRSLIGDFCPNKELITMEHPVNEDISVVVLTYNHERTIAETMDSILMQEMPYSFKIYCLNDASTDGTEKILLSYQARYPQRIKVYTNKINQGSGKLTCYYQKPPVSGRYWCFLEGDDYWTRKDKLAKQIFFLDKNPKFVGSSTYTTVMDEVTGNTGLIRPDKDEWNLFDLILLKNYYSFYVHTSSIVWRNIYKDKGFFLPPAYKSPIGKGDVVLMYMMLARGGQIHNFPEEMSCYRVTGDGLWTKKTSEEKALLLQEMNLNLERSLPLRYKIYRALKMNLLKKTLPLGKFFPGPINKGSFFEF